MDQVSPLPLTDVIVLGEGPIPADGFLAGQGPGADEVLMYLHGLTPRSFIGMAGQEMDEYLHQAGINRPDLYITNCYKHFLVGNRRPTVTELEDHREILLEEIAMTCPLVIGGVGDCASEWLSHLSGQSFRDMESEHGIPRWITINGHECIMVPLYHPAAGLYAPSAMGKIWYDFQIFGRVLRGELLPADAPGEIYTSVYHNSAYWKAGLDPFLNSDTVAVDTEGDVDDPWGLTFSTHEAYGWKIGAEEKELLSIFNAAIHKYKCTVILQNSLHDIPVLLSMGIDVHDLQIIDTMILAYLLCVEPQGLKALGWRHMRVAMHPYSEIADPVTEAKTKQYLEAAAEIDWDRCPECGKADAIGKKHYDFNHTPVDWLTSKGNIRKKYLPNVIWCPGGEKGAGTPINKRIQRILQGANTDGATDDSEGTVQLPKVLHAGGA